MTSHAVKYSHHPDGRVHFSQDAKVRTEIRRQSVALGRQNGHIFSVLIQGLEAFDKAGGSEDARIPRKRTAMNFQLPNLPEPRATKLIGRWYHISALPLSGDPPEVVGPVLPTQGPGGHPQNGFLLASPSGNAQHVLFITCQVIPILGGEPEQLLFIGGFDPPDVAADMSKEAGFLALTYPATDVENLRKIIGTIDLTPSDVARQLP